MAEATSGITFLCGVIKKDSESLLANGIICLRNGERIEVSRNDPGLAHLKPGRPRLVVAKDGFIWAIYSRPRVKLLRQLERGGVLTEEILEVYIPKYLGHRR